MKFYAGEEGGAEVDGPDATAGWREPQAHRQSSQTLVAPKASAQRYAIRVQCKAAGDYYQVFYYYTIAFLEIRLAPGSALWAKAEQTL